jgi:N-dimethylarginine dimethylaminohydrolase
MIPPLSEHGQLAAVLMKHPRHAFINDAVVAAQWRELNFSSPPDLARAVDEYERFVEIISSNGCEILFLPESDATTLDSIYTRDATVESPLGMILASMGKRSRGSEPDAQSQELRRSGWPIGGAVALPGHLEGGDLMWLDEKTVAVGLGARTDLEGIQQLKTLLNGTIDELIVVPLPDDPGPHDVMHLMSLVSPVDRNLAVVYSRLLPDDFKDTLQRREYQLIDVPDDEYGTMATNVLALAPRECVMLDGNPRTRAALEKAGAAVHVYEGREISLKGGGGPTCLTRPLVRL